MKQCKCEHWQECPVCQPRRFDTEGNRLPPEPTPLQAARARVAALERERDRNLERERERNLDSINVANAIINKKNERIAELEAALRVALEALELAVSTCFDRRAHEEVMSRPEHFINQAITKITEVRRES